MKTLLVTLLLASLPACATIDATCPVDSLDNLTTNCAYRPWSDAHVPTLRYNDDQSEALCLRAAELTLVTDAYQGGPQQIVYCERSNEQCTDSDCMSLGPNNADIEVPFDLSQSTQAHWLADVIVSYWEKD